jgi:hypothetical protein
MRRTGRLFSFAAIALLAAGCLGPGTTQSPRLFVLTATALPASAEASASSLRLGVGPVDLPERLNRLQILTLAGPNEVKISQFSQWAEPLDKSVNRVLAENLSRLIPTNQVFLYPWSTRTAVDFQVEIDVIRFEGQIGDQVSLAARWRLLDSSGREVGAPRLSQYTQPTPDNTTEALVSAMSQTLGALSRDIAAKVANAAAP